jgi:hypothetical protein
LALTLPQICFQLHPGAGASTKQGDTRPFPIQLRGYSIFAVSAPLMLLRVDLADQLFVAASVDNA